MHRNTAQKKKAAPRYSLRTRAVRDTENGSSRSQAAQDDTCDCNVSQEPENLFVIISGNLAVALVFLQRCLHTCISTIKEIIQKKSGLTIILSLIVIAATAGAYWGTLLPIQVLWAKKVPQVLQEQAAGELMSMQNSLAVMGKESQEVQQLKIEVLRLTADLQRVKKELQDMRMAMSAMPLEENALVSDWTVKSVEVAINLELSPRSYSWPCTMFRYLCDLKRLDTFVQMDTSPGYCWTSPTSQSHVVIRLPTHVQPTAITLQHPLMKYSVLGDISSAPRDFSVFGMNEGGEEETLLGTFSYEIEEESSQTFPLQEVSGAFQHIKLFIQNNWGNRRHTCIYRVQVDGRIKKMNTKGQA